MNTAEQRKHRRKHLLFYLRVYSADSGEFMGHAADLSKGGLLLLSEEPLEKKNYVLDVRPPTKDAPANPVHISAETRWKANHKNPLLYSTGFEITDANPNEIETLQNLISKYGERSEATA